jgi:hypothetical protein
MGHSPDEPRVDSDGLVIYPDEQFAGQKKLGSDVEQRTPRLRGDDDPEWYETPPEPVEQPNEEPIPKQQPTEPGRLRRSGHLEIVAPQPHAKQPMQGPPVPASPAPARRSHRQVDLPLRPGRHERGPPAAARAPNSDVGGASPCALTR